MASMASMAALMAAASFALPVPLAAQDPDYIRPLPRCVECRIVFDSVAVLGAGDGEGALHGPTVIRQDGAGRFIVAQTFAGELAAVFRPDGSFLSTIGRKGDGPGEYRSIGALSVAGPVLYLYDEGTQRISAVDEDLEFVSSVPLRGAAIVDAVALGSGDHVVNMLMFDAATRGFALHIVNSAGELVRSVEPFDAASGGPTAHFRHVFRDADGAGFWSVTRFGRISVRHYSEDGELLTDWSAPPSPGDDLPMTYGNPDEGRLPTRQIVASWLQNDRIWTASAIPTAHWSDGLARSEDDSHGASFTPVDPDQVYDPAVEIFDAHTGELVAAQYPESQPFQLPVAAGLAAKLISDDLGWIYLHIRRARLVDRR